MAYHFRCHVFFDQCVWGKRWRRCRQRRNHFRQCQDCHATKKGVNKEGPSLYSVIGRPAGSKAGYTYSDAMKASAAKGLIWTVDNVLKYLANPHQFFVNYLGAPDTRNKMVFRLANEQDREDVVAYLQSVPTM
jgi:cytochrome c